MKERFFDGGDYKKGEFKALIPDYYPLKYKAYIKQETKLLKKKVRGANRVLEAGVGIGRLIPELSPIVKEFVGIDNAKLMLKLSRKVAKNFPNVEIIKGDLENLNKIFPENYFDFSICVWNTLGNVKNEVKILKQLSKATSKTVFVTVYLKGTLEDRKNWYKKVGVKIKKIDEKNEIFYSESGLRSKSYSLEDIKKMANKSDLKIKRYKILNKVILWVELIK